MSLSASSSKPYCYWKFREAVRLLATGEEPLRKRIMFALVSFVALQERDMPEAMKAPFLELRAQTTWKVDGDPEAGSWENTLAEMSDDDAEKVAELIVKLFELSVEEGPPMGMELDD
jgi:hypothetical protein